MCSCKVFGNPPPKLEWRLAGKTVFPSEVTSVEGESACDLSSRSFFTIRQSFIHTPTLLCVGSNHLGVDTHLLNSIISGGQPQWINKTFLCFSYYKHIFCFFPRKQLHCCTLSGSPSLCASPLLCVGVIGCLIYKLKQ